MLWVVVFIVVAAAVAYAVAKSRGAGVAVQAEYERIKRTEPDSPLAQYGPNEFEMAWNRAVTARNKKNKLDTMKGLPIFLACVAGGLFLASFLMPDDEMGPILGLLLGAGIGGWYLKKTVTDRLPTVREYLEREAAV